MHRRLRENDAHLTQLETGWDGMEGIGDKGATRVGEALAVNSVLTKLSLGDRFLRNRIGREGAAKLGAALAVNASLVCLDLAHNEINSRGATEMASSLRVNSALTRLVLTGNQIGDSGAALLAQALQKNTSLKALHLGCNDVGDVGATEIADALRVNTTLTCLQLRGLFSPISVRLSLSIFSSSIARTHACDTQTIQLGRRDFKHSGTLCCGAHSHLASRRPPATPAAAPPSCCRSTATARGLMAYQAWNRKSFPSVHVNWVGRSKRAPCREETTTVPRVDPAPSQTCSTAPGVCIRLLSSWQCTQGLERRALPTYSTTVLCTLWRKPGCDPGGLACHAFVKHVMPSSLFRLSRVFTVLVHVGLSCLPSMCIPMPCCVRERRCQNCREWQEPYVPTQFSAHLVPAKAVCQAHTRSDEGSKLWSRPG